MISVTTGASRSAFSFNSHAGMLSGHDAFARLSEESFFKTQNSVAKGRVLISACGSSLVGKDTHRGEKGIVDGIGKIYRVDVLSAVDIPEC